MTEPINIPLLSNNELDDLYFRARHDFDREAVLQLIQYFGEALKPDGHVPLSGRATEILHDWIGPVFCAISEDERHDANLALGLSRRRGRPESYRDLDELSCILAAKVMIQIEHLKGQGVSNAYQTALGDVANEVYGPDSGDSRVKSAYDDHKNLLEQLRSIAPNEVKAMAETVINLDEFKAD